MFRREVFMNKIGKFEEVSRTGDDKILGKNFNEKGEEIYYFQDLYVYTECYSNSIKKFIQQRIRWARDLYINPLKKKEILRLIILFGIALFKLFYPVGALIIALLFFNPMYIVLFLLPWIIFYFLYLIYFYLKLKRMSFKVNNQLKTDFSYKKAFKIVPLLLFAYGIITIVSIINPKRNK